MAGRPVFVFDTYGPLDADPAKNEQNKKWFYPGGGEKLKDVLTAQGVVVYPEVLRCLVTDMKGPLVDDALESAREFARRFMTDRLR